MLDTSIQVSLDQFDGPLALLLMLVEREEMDIRKLDVGTITEQYLDYLAKMRELNFDVAGDYLFLASTLLLIKSKECLSEEEAKSLKESLGSSDLNITSQSELIRRLEELQRMQKLSKKLMDLPRRGEEIFTRPKINRKALVNSMLMPMDLDKLTSAMIDFIRKEKRKYTVVKRDKLSIKEKLVFLKKFLKENKRYTFESVLQEDKSAEPKEISNIVITFISLLELARLGRVSVFQTEESSEVYIEVLKDLNDFNVEIADGFEVEDGGQTGDIEETNLPEENLLDANTSSEILQ